MINIAEPTIKNDNNKPITIVKTIVPIAYPIYNQ